MTLTSCWVMVMWSEDDVIHSRHDHNGLSHMLSERDGAVISLPVIVMVCFYSVYLRMELWGDSLSTCDQGSRQGRASPGPAALGPPFLAGPGSPGPAGPRCSQPCRVRAGPRARKAFACYILLYNVLGCCTIQHFSLLYITPPSSRYNVRQKLMHPGHFSQRYFSYRISSNIRFHSRTSSSIKTAMEMRLLQ